MSWTFRGSKPGGGQIFRIPPDRLWDLPRTCHTENSKSIYQKQEETFKLETIFEIWSLLKSEYPETAQLAVGQLLPFVTTYRCEAAISKTVLTKTRQRRRLNLEADMPVHL
jgi:hypothetical protein